MTTLFIAVLNMSITASIVAMAVMLTRIPLRKAPKLFSYALWSAVLFRLVFPFSFESVFSLMPASSNAIPQDIITSQSPAIHTGVPFVDLPMNAAMYNAFPRTIYESVNPIHVFLEISGYVWLVGFIALLLYAVIGYVRLKRRVYFATLIRDNIYETDKIRTPFVLGFISPKIYFPTTLDPTQHDYIVKHEQTHIKRRDYLVKTFAYIVLALHWFNPLMWVSYLLMSKDMEMSCDEAVLKQTDRDIRGNYSSSLLNLSMEKASLLNPIAFGESNVVERVVNVLRFKKPAKWVVVISLVAVLFFFLGFMSNRVREDVSALPASSDDMFTWETASSVHPAASSAVEYPNIIPLPDDYTRSPNIHIVQSGENLRMIAQLHFPDDDVYEAIEHIAAINLIHDLDVLHAYRVLIIVPMGYESPPFATHMPPPELPVIHIVQTGENLHVIARWYFPFIYVSDSILHIATTNNIRNPSHLRVGQRLLIESMPETQQPLYE